VSGDRHEEIAARLRQEGAARAPERLRAEVMEAVRAQPRARRTRRPRPTRWPLGSLAAAACVLAALVFGISHLNGTGASSSSAGAAAASAGAEAAQPALAPTRGDEVHAPAPVHAQTTHGAAGLQALRYRQVLTQAPRPLRYALLGRARLAAPLPKALGTLELRTGRGSHGR
jgi:negative regulator of sigma E activity